MKCGVQAARSMALPLDPPVSGMKAPESLAEVTVNCLKVRHNLHIVGVNHLANSRRDTGEDKPRRPPATTREAREAQLVNMAMDESERLIREGKATSQLLTHYLKLGSTRENLEQERLRGENELLKAKVESLKSAASMETLYKEAIAAFGVYRGDPQQIPDE